MENGALFNSKDHYQTLEKELQLVSLIVVYTFSEGFLVTFSVMLEYSTCNSKDGD